MKTFTISFLLAFTSLTACGSTGTKTAQGNDPEKTSGQIVVLDKALFIKEIFDYESSSEWKYKGDKPAIIDFYADWCGPCRMVAPIMKQLAEEYDGKIVIYKIDTDKEQELAALFKVSSIPMFLFINRKGELQSMVGAADKATYKKYIDEFLLKE